MTKSKKPSTGGESITKSGSGKRNQWPKSYEQLIARETAKLARSIPAEALQTAEAAEEWAEDRLAKLAPMAVLNLEMRMLAGLTKMSAEASREILAAMHSRKNRQSGEQAPRAPVVVNIVAGDHPKWMKQGPIVDTLALPADSDKEGE